MNAPQVEDGLQEELESGERGFIRAKWSLDGATTLLEAAQKARDLAGWLHELHEQGFVLDDEIADDYGMYHRA